MKRCIILAGGGGFLGHALANYFLKRDREIIVLTRRPHERADGVREVEWDAEHLGEWIKCLDGAETVINLTGRSVDCRYNEKNCREIISSRVNSTRAIGIAIDHVAHPPRIWLNASSATLYKHSFDKPMDENGETGATPEAKDEFSVDVIRQWESALDDVKTPATRKIALRITLVFGKSGGVFPVLRRLAKFGLAGAMGGGRQMVSWIHEEDFCRAVEWIISRENLSGPINLAAPGPLSNREMMRLIRKACGVPIGLPATKWMLEAGAFFLRTETELLIKSRFVVPGKLTASGFQFQFPDLHGALADLCK